MRASFLIGRVGGLAVALGIGGALFAGAGVAWADTDAAGESPSVGAPRAASTPGSAARSKRVVAQARPAATAATRVGSGPRPAAATAAPQRGPSAPRAARITQPAQSMPAPAASAARTASAAESLFGGSIAVDPSVSWSEGILFGTLGATSSRGLDLTYKVICDPSLGGKIAWQPTPAGTSTQPDTFTYLPYMTTLSNPGQTEQFSILVTEVTGFDTFMKQLPVVGLLADPVIELLHRLPIINAVLAPLIGAARLVDFSESPSVLAGGNPVGFTYKMPSFDGTLISLNYFPAYDVAAGDVASAPTILNGPDLGFPGNTDVFTPWDPSLVNIVPGIVALRSDANPLTGGYTGTGGYNVITWDPRGEYASGGVMQLDNPNFEGRDVSSIITWATSTGNVAQGQIATDQTGDPFIGMVGGSYGGGIQLAVAGTPDKRVDAIVPSIAWNTLNQSLYPSDTFKTVIGSELLLALIATGARINPQIYLGIATGALFGWLSETSQALLANSGPGILTNNITAPTLILQGTPDILFELNAAMTNGQMIAQANPQVPLKTTWFCGGHGVCLLPQSQQTPQGSTNMDDTLRWLDQYVAHNGTPADDIPAFQWYDQVGNYHSSDLAPFDPAFNNPDPLTYSGGGGGLVLVPLLGGSGPSKAAVPPDKATTFSTAFALASGGKAWNALNVDVTPSVGTVIAGTPSLSFTYQGLGTSRAVYAQLVDNATGEVVGNIVTPIPVVLDGREHTVQIPMAPIAYTVGDVADSMTLQITSSALPYTNLTAWGFVDIGDVRLEIPTVA